MTTLTPAQTKRNDKNLKALNQVSGGGVWYSWEFEGAESSYRMDCKDGMFCHVIRVKAGWVITRKHPDGRAQSGMFHETFKAVVGTCKASNS